MGWRGHCISQRAGDRPGCCYGPELPATSPYKTVRVLVRAATAAVRRGDGLEFLDGYHCSVCRREAL